MAVTQPKLGSGERFKRLSTSLSKRPGVTDPDALAAVIGRNKYGSAKMTQLSEGGKKWRGNGSNDM